ncbi:hypothetical protein [Argonema antarcticum]|uniref:hypothetical protein n=1 Tax=Argonema antarcticum TaxID=2942763 RepID=UPI002013AF72|nr:hypothetical protein [Argonema antarcticum]MCL1470445.1 hypothetical protein [Argonema antarcticum A004/B2]
MESNKKCDRSFYQLIQLVVKSAIAFTSPYINDRICQVRSHSHLIDETGFLGRLLKRAVL